MVFLSVTGLAISTNRVSAEIVVFSDNFDTETPGNPPGNFTDTSDSNASVTISAARSVSASNSMFLDDNTGSGVAKAVASFSPISSGVVKWEFEFQEAGSGGILRALLRDSSGQDAFLLWSSSGSLLFRTPTDDVAIGSFSLNEWNKVTILADLTTDTADAFYNGSSAGTDLAFTASVSNFASMQFGTSKGRTADLYIDDVLVVPEPGSLSLLVVGWMAVFVFGRRRRSR